MVAQAYKEIPKTIRTNWTALIIFEISNDREILSIYEEHTMGLKFPEWLEMFNYAIKEDFNFLYLNATKPKHLRVMKNFTSYLFHKKDDLENPVEEVSKPSI